jgi:uncharacterized protein (DUF1810 family)
MMSDIASHDLQRFLVAQDQSYDGALAELLAGRKRGHWMWTIFPQLKGLGHSAMAEHYGIVSLDEARAYLAHPVLGLRLEAVTRAVLGWPDRSLGAIFGTPDDLKFYSSMTLFAQASDLKDNVFVRAIDLFCDGRMDVRTLTLLDHSHGG